MRTFFSLSSLLCIVAGILPLILMRYGIDWRRVLVLSIALYLCGFVVSVISSAVHTAKESITSHAPTSQLISNIERVTSEIFANTEPQIKRLHNILATDGHNISMMFYIDPGRSDQALIQELLIELNQLHLTLGGKGFRFTYTGNIMDSESTEN
jgi:hypothetical protein